MYWQKRFSRPDPDADIKTALTTLRETHKDYGYLRMTAALRNAGHGINKKKVQRLMADMHLQVESYTRRSRKYNAYRGTVGKTAPNRINRRFDTPVAHQKITTDTSEFKYYERDASGRLVEQKLYLDPFMDLYNREIISFNISRRPSAAGILSALATAIEASTDCPYRRTFHSDQGWAYQMQAYRGRLEAHGILQSMSRKGNCLDNAPMENFFSIIKQEIYHGNTYHSFESLKRAIIHFITYYNTERIKEKLGWLSPVQYRTQQEHQLKNA